jgi:cell wall integrity and stress response component
MLNKNVLGLSDGENCWCGDEIPAKEWQIPDGNCSTTCGGDKTHKCGGANKLWVKLTGNTRNEVEYFVPKVSSSASKSVASVIMTSAAVRASATASAEAENSDNGPNKAGIAAGVVVGVVAIAAIIGGVWFFLRRRRQQQAEDDYRRNAANVNSFVNGGKTSASSMNDSRLDPSFVDRRQSNGSIADNEDYSRRILKVTNV